MLILLSFIYRHCSLFLLDFLIKFSVFLFLYFQLAEMVNLHFLSLIEALQEINSIVLANVCHLCNYNKIIFFVCYFHLVICYVGTCFIHTSKSITSSCSSSSSNMFKSSTIIGNTGRFTIYVWYVWKHV